MPNELNNIIEKTPTTRGNNLAEKTLYSKIIK